ncbi:WxcM-like domain-containing protein [Chryseobacterium tructae]|uniref:WxcM-like domain-containing protein n=1 Tax=Chryseobacterium tructae TaxID=1037380 RepID=A0ABV7XUH7_9FLAO|nr:WxcM-like domain-containing protein [Chryseobacterium tructae]MDN3691674.1 WxcM-like domain-containing protein [Chryseobacterium tructae]
MKVPEIFKGGQFSDERGRLIFNNTFDASEVKRLYYIEDIDTESIRGWIGHKVEQRWLSAIQGKFMIKLIYIDNWKTPYRKSEILEFELSSGDLTILHIPQGYVSAIQTKEEKSKLLVMADYSLGEIDDSYRFPIDYFENL